MNTITQGMKSKKLQAFARYEKPNLDLISLKEYDLQMY